jgi:hypothetical protein
MAKGPNDLTKSIGAPAIQISRNAMVSFAVVDVVMPANCRADRLPLQRIVL